MRVKGTIRVRSVDKSAAAFVCNDIYGSLQGITSKLDRDNTFINFNSAGQICRNVVDAETGRRTIHRNAVDEQFYTFTGKPVDINGGSRPYATVRANTHS